MKKLVGLVAATAFAVSAIGAPVAAALCKYNGQKAPRVWICHFPGHQAAEPWPGGGVTLDGDYVLLASNIDADGPNSNAQDYCADHGGGGRLIEVNANSLDGHGAQLQERVDDY